MADEAVIKYDYEGQLKSIGESLDVKFFSIGCIVSEMSKILSYRLAAIKERYCKSKADYIYHSLMGMASIYGIGEKEEEVKDCREKMYQIWLDAYRSICANNLDWNMDNTAHMLIEKSVVFTPMCSVDIDVVCNDDGKAKYEYSSVSIHDAAGKPILLPVWEIVGKEEFRYYGLNPDKMKDKKYIKRYDIDISKEISEYLQFSEADDLGLDEDQEEIDPEAYVSFTLEHTLPGLTSLSLDMDRRFAVREYKPVELRYLWSEQSAY